MLTRTYDLFRDIPPAADIDLSLVPLPPSLPDQTSKSKSSKKVEESQFEKEEERKGKRKKKKKKRKNSGGRHNDDDDDDEVNKLFEKNIFIGLS